MMKKRMPPALAGLILAVAYALFFSSGRVLAHAFLIGSDPPDGAILSSAPSQVQLYFSEAVSPVLTTAELTDGDGKSYEPLLVRQDATNPATLVIDLPPLGRGIYRLSWETISDDDFHESTGTLVFGVGQAVTPGGQKPAPPPSTLELVLRWFNLAALVILIGTITAQYFFLPSEIPLTALPSLLSLERNSHVLALAGGVAAWLSGIGLLATQGRVIGPGFGMNPAFLQTGYGARWLAGQLAILLLLVLLRARLHPLAVPLTLRAKIVQAVVAIVIVAAQAMNSHAAAFAVFSLPRVIAQAIHLLGACIWIGGIFWLVVLVLPLLRGVMIERALALTILRRFGIPAAIALVFQVVTGLYLTGLQVASLDALLLTFYGRSLALKLMIAGLAGLTGLLNAISLHPRLGKMTRPFLHLFFGRDLAGLHRLPTRIRLEAVLVLGLLFLAGALTASPPARGPQFAPPSREDVPARITRQADDLLITFSLRPNRPGQNFVEVNVHDTRRPAPAAIESVMVRLSPTSGDAPLELIASPAGGDGYRASVEGIRIPGDWTVDVRIRREGLPEAVMSAPWKVQPPSSPVERQTLLSNAPLAPVTDSIALALLIVFGAVLLCLSLGRLLRDTPLLNWLSRSLDALRRG